MSLLHLLLFLLLCVVLPPCHGLGVPSTISEQKFQKQRESRSACHLRSNLPHSEGDTASRKHMGFSTNNDGKSVKEFSYNEIEKATDKFTNLLDDTGGNGKVYRGKLDDGTEIAVKCPIECNGFNTPIDHMKNEIKIHAHVKHLRIVRLLGYFPHPHKPCIVYEYMSRGNLFNRLHYHCDPHHVAQGVTFLPWPQRLTIADQVSEALVHLHNERIIHADVKSANILFDDHLNAELSDFGHSQIIDPGKSHISMPAEGTPHLIDPYWRKTKQLTDKTDVYSFGILLVELLTSQKAADLEREKDGAIVVEKGRLMKSIDPSLKAGGSQVVLEQMMALGSLAVNCLSQHIINRPMMKEVAEEIKRIMRLDSCPSSFPFALEQMMALG